MLTVSLASGKSEEHHPMGFLALSFIIIKCGGFGVATTRLPPDIWAAMITVFYMSRRDKIAQAVSLYRAVTTQIWSSLDLQYSDNNYAHAKNKTVNFDASRIAKLMSLLTKEEEHWRSFMQTHELSFSELCYEDFVEDYVGQSLRLLKLLGVELKGESIPPPQLKRQSQDDDPMIVQFKKTVGLRVGTNAPCDRGSA